MCESHDPDSAVLNENNAIPALSYKQCKVCLHKRCGLCYDFIIVRSRVEFSDGQQGVTTVAEDYRPATPELEFNDGEYYQGDGSVEAYISLM